MNQIKIQQLKWKITEWKIYQRYSAVDLNQQKKESVNLNTGQKRLGNQKDKEKKHEKMDKPSGKCGTTLHVSTYT